MEKIVEVENLNFSYGRYKALDDVSFYIGQGDYAGVIGPNGSAKSTLLKLMLGLLKPDSGTIKVFGEKVENIKEYKDIGYISQNARDFNRMFPATVEEIVALNTEGNFFKNRELDRVEEALKIVDMEKFKDRKIGNLSGGQKQRVFIARAIVNMPKILFMDEPLVGVDLDSQKKFYQLMNKLNKEYKMTLVMVSHDIDIISVEADRLICLDNKKVYSHYSKECNCVEQVKEIYGESMDILLKNH